MRNVVLGLISLLTVTISQSTFAASAQFQWHGTVPYPTFNSSISQQHIPIGRELSFRVNGQSYQYATMTYNQHLGLKVQVIELVM